MKKLVVGILAHVDAGKTTLSEGMLYLAGRIQRLGRVDKRTAFLDTHDLEKERGITIFSKQAVFALGDLQITLLDTPGHVDFSTEMERTLQVLDYAILVISGADGVQGHTSTLWRLLDVYKVPVFIFVNKMDQPGTDKAALLEELQERLDSRCTEFGGGEGAAFFERVALCDEGLFESYLAAKQLSQEEIKEAVRERKVFPCYFGSALHLDGVEEFMRGLARYAVIPSYPQEFGAKVFKISRDEQGSRLTHLKVTGGVLKVRDEITGEGWKEKVNQIRIYSGQKYEAVGEVSAGTVCAVTGLTQTRPGQGIGGERGLMVPVLEPVLSYRVVLPEELEPRVMLPKLKELEEEAPELSVVWDEQLQEIQVQIMGEVQIEILQRLISERFGVNVSFDAGRILYKETIASTVEGIGHFEPLGHYAEVHLLLEPAPRGSGLEFAADCSEDFLAKNWQRLILTHLAEKAHKGVLTGAPITDMKITLVAGRAHLDHTQGGDFREATYRAVRQGLMQAESVLLEPYYEFRLEVPEKVVGRAITDLESKHGTWEIAGTSGEMTILTGRAPVATMQNYAQEVAAYTRGQGRLFCSSAGYFPCHNGDEVIARIGYDAEADVDNPPGSVFCAGGAGFHVPWDQVKDYMHIEAQFREGQRAAPGSSPIPRPRAGVAREQFEYDHDDYPYLQTTGNLGRKSSWKERAGQRRAEAERGKGPSNSLPPRENYLLVDGYNVIHAWPELKGLAQEDMDIARTRLLDALSSYQAVSPYKIIVVFDAYSIKDRQLAELEAYHNIHVVFTKAAQTADQYIEKFAFDNQDKYNITVATSDGLQQVIIRGAGSALLSARELREAMESALELSQESYMRRQGTGKASLTDILSPQTVQQIEGLGTNEENK
ncbi:MAG TPA: GTP-binding protein [Firmicutes bacterium]|jgi:small GTP-binding protein|nr:GTP-binding protein [Bacillota bacterium]